jgi:hypothetical protein
MVTSRRQLLGALGAFVGAVLAERRAFASLARELSLEVLLFNSEHVVVATPLDSSSDWAELGGQRRIVTDVRVRVEDTLALKPPAQSELIVRLLGGVVGKLGQRVAGEVRLVQGEPCTLFLTAASPTLTYVTGRAQGHYPLRPDAQKLLRLQPSPSLPELLHPEKSAVTTLSGKSLAEARELMRAASP